MADRGGEFTFLQDNHLRIDMRTDISISVRPITIKIGKQTHQEELTQKLD